MSIPHAALTSQQNNIGSGFDSSFFIVIAFFAACIILAWMSYRLSSRQLTSAENAEKRIARYPEVSEALGQLDKDQVQAVDAIREMMESELGTTEKNIRMDSIKIGVVSFIAGGALTFAVTLFVHPLH